VHEVTVQFELLSAFVMHAQPGVAAQAGGTSTHWPSSVGIPPSGSGIPGRVVQIVP
jgi:hypothetical protein